MALVEGEFDVLPRADRMAVCVSAVDNGSSAKAAALSSIPYGLSEFRIPELEGLRQYALVGGQQMSEGSVSGTVQLPPDGNPVILLAEHQTTGGYKVPAVVIQADLWRVAQMRPGDRLRFRQTTAGEAARALQELRTAARATIVVG
jgi:allophanate hydrolase subunit 2